jgi:hypothetical protein
VTVLAAGHPFRRHSKNLVAVKKGLLQLERLHRAAIGAGDQPAVDTLARFHMLTVGLMAEAQMRKILWDPDGFNDRERRLLLRTHQLERWEAAVEYAFRRHYSVPVHRELDRFILGTIPFGQLQSVQELLNSHLSVVVDDRNKTAHAQWAWHLNNKETTFTERAPKPLNYLAIKTRSDLIGKIGDLVHALAVSEPTFQRDFDAISAEISRLVPLVDGNGYDKYARDARRRKAAFLARAT